MTMATNPTMRPAIPSASMDKNSLTYNCQITVRLPCDAGWQAQKGTHRRGRRARTLFFKIVGAEGPSYFRSVGLLWAGPPKAPRRCAVPPPVRWLTAPMAGSPPAGPSAPLAAASPQQPQSGIRRAEAATYQLSRAYATTASVMRPGRTPRPIRMNWFIGPKPPPALLAALRMGV
jgi:hypothetical protein